MQRTMRDSEKTEAETQALVARAKGGDREAFDAIVERNRGPLRSRIESWSRFQLGPRLDLDDLLQEAFIRAFRGVRRFEWQEEDAFFRWLCGVARMALAEAARSAWREARQKADGSAGHVAAPDPTPSKLFRRGERFDRLEAALEKLSADYREALLLARIEGLTVNEIAKRMSRSPDSVKHLIARGLRELKRHFGDTESFRLADRRLKREGDERGD